MKQTMIHGAVHKCHLHTNFKNVFGLFRSFSDDFFSPVEVLAAAQRQLNKLDLSLFGYPISAKENMLLFHSHLKCPLTPQAFSVQYVS